MWGGFHFTNVAFVFHQSYYERIATEQFYLDRAKFLSLGEFFISWLSNALFDFYVCRLMNSGKWLTCSLLLGQTLEHQAQQQRCFISGRKLECTNPKLWRLCQNLGQVTQGDLQSSFTAVLVLVGQVCAGYLRGSFISWTFKCTIDPFVTALQKSSHMGELMGHKCAPYHKDKVNEWCPTIHCVCKDLDVPIWSVVCKTCTNSPNVPPSWPHTQNMMSGEMVVYKTGSLTNVHSTNERRQGIAIAYSTTLL